jgi:hypothetical protein
VLLLPAALLVGYVLPLVHLRRRAAVRRERLRVELVGFLYGLAAFVVAGPSTGRSTVWPSGRGSWPTSSSRPVSSTSRG